MKFQCFTGRMNGGRFVAFLKKLRADAGRPIIVIADNASYHGSGPVRRYMEESEGQVWAGVSSRWAKPWPSDGLCSSFQTRCSGLVVSRLPPCSI
jgi:hypothetical protein